MTTKTVKQRDMTRPYLYWFACSAVTNNEVSGGCVRSRRLRGRKQDQGITYIFFGVVLRLSSTFHHPLIPVKILLPGALLIRPSWGAVFRKEK